MLFRLLILLVVSVAVVFGITVFDISMNVTADDGAQSYVGEASKPENTPGPHFAYQQQQLAQASGLARLDLPPTSIPLPAGQTFRNATMPTPLPTNARRQNVEIIRDVLLDAKKANPDLNATNIKALVQDGDMITILVECNCNPKPVLIGSRAPETPVKYLTFKVDRRYLGAIISAGPENENTRNLIARGSRFQ